jgi:acetylornithine deacetylase
MNLFELTRRLISIPSISGGEKDVVEFLSRYLSDRGFEIDLQEVERDRFNLYAGRGRADVVLSTHTDTVPPISNSGKTTSSYTAGARAMRKA